MMRASLQMLCERFVRNRDVIRRHFKWSNGVLQPVCAYLFCAGDREADGQKLLKAQTLVKGREKWHSSFRNNVLTPLCCLLSMEADMDNALERTLQVHGALRTCFYASDHLALGAALMKDRQDAPEMAVRAKQLYQRMRKQHAFLTDAADVPLTLLLSQSDRQDDVLLDEMERCFAGLKGRFGNNNWTWQAAQLLSLSTEPADDKCARLTALFDAIRQNELKVGRSHELPALAALSLTGRDAQLLGMDLADVDGFLAAQAGYGVFGTGKRMRLLHALLILSCEFPRDAKLDTAVLGAVLSLLIAQQQAAF